ncbi:hypothetical protein ACWEKM_45795, partial [Streptomyces sp. NPDC004752]
MSTQPASDGHVLGVAAPVGDITEQYGAGVEAARRGPAVAAPGGTREVTAAFAGTFCGRARTGGGATLRDTVLPGAAPT